jgi:peptidyl-prolyl cis-trans isomerase C
MYPFRITFILLLSLLSCLPLHAEDQANPVLTRVNGVEITLKQLEFFLSKQQNAMSPQQALAEMVSVELLVQAARNENMLKNLTLSHEIRHSTSNLIASHYLTRFIESIKIDEALLQELYQQQYLQGAPDLEYNAAHILVGDEAGAKDLIEQLKQGADFAELARAYSTGPSGVEGGALGWFKQTDMVAPFADATAGLEPGHFTQQPVQTRFGWHVIQLNQIRELTPPEFQTVKSQLRTELVAQRISQMIRDLHSRASVVYAAPKSPRPESAKPGSETR